MKIEELNRTVLNLTEELDFRKEQLSTTEKLINTFRDDFSNAYDKGMRVNKAIKHEFETNLHQAQNKIKDLEDRIKSLEQDRETTKYELRKTDRALSSARKVAMVERNFLEVIKKIENKRKEKKLALDKSLKDRAEQDNEEKKKLRTKIKILKEAYNRLNEQYQSSQVIEKELQNKIKECDSLKLQLKRLTIPMAPISANSPRAALDYSMRSSPGTSVSETPVRKSSGQSDSGFSGSSKQASEKDIPSAPVIVIQSPTTLSSSPGGPPAKWNSVKNPQKKLV